MSTPKKPATKKSAEKNVAAPKKCACARKSCASAKKPTEEAKPAKKVVDDEPAKKDVGGRKPITVVKKTVKPPTKKAEQSVPFENNCQSFAYSFADEMKRRQREEDAARENANGGIKLPHRPTSRTKGSDSQQFSDADLAEFRKRLILLRQETLGQSAKLRNVALEQSDDRGGEEEDGSDAFMRLQSLSQVDSRAKLIQKIDDALIRIDDGSYGICEHCGKLIRKPRLVNLPFVHTCMECQMQMENARR